MTSGRGAELDPAANVYKFSSTLEISGVFIEPGDRSGEPVKIAIYGDEFEENEFLLKVKDFHAVDNELRPVYKKKGNRELPVYALPNGLGIINKLRGKNEWQGWYRVPAAFAAVLLTVLNCNQVVYLTITECKVERTRWIYRLALQTNDPEDD